MPDGAAHRFAFNEGANLTDDNLNSLDIGGNVYAQGAGSLNVNVSPCVYVHSGGSLAFGGAAGVAIPASTLASKVYLTVTGNVLTVAPAFPGGVHLPLAEVDTSGTEVIAIRDKRHAMAASVGSAAGDVVGPGVNTASALAQFSGTTGKLLQDGPVPGAASGIATLSAGKVVQDPANAQAGAALAKIPLGGAGGKLDDGWLNHNPPFGADFQSQAAAGRLTNATATPQAHTTLSIPVGRTGTYEVKWKAELDNAGFEGRVDLYDVTGAAVLDGPQSQICTGANDKRPVGGFAQIVLAGSAKDVAVRFWDVAGANTQGLQGVKLSLHRVL